MPIADDAGFRRRTAHIESDGVAHAELRAHRLGADHPGGRTRFEHAHAFAPRLLDGKQAAGRLHDIELAGEATGA